MPMLSDLPASAPAHSLSPYPTCPGIQGGVQEGIVELVHTGGASFDSGVVMVKVLVNP